jgi:hypothetical protein
MLSDTPENDLGWGMSLRRGTETKPQRIQVEGFLNLHLGKKAAVQPVIVFSWDGGRCTPARVPLKLVLVIAVCFTEPVNFGTVYQRM